MTTSTFDLFDNVGFSDNVETMLSQLDYYGIDVGQASMDPINNPSDLEKVKIFSVVTYRDRLKEIKKSLNTDYVDDFIELTNCWGATGTVQILGGVGGQLGLTTGSSTNDVASLNFAIKNLQLDCKFMISFRFQLGQTGNTVLEMGGIDDSDNLTRFIYDSSSDSKWVAESKNSGSSTTSTLSNADTKWHTFKIESTGSSLKYSTDQQIIATHTTNVPTTLMRIYIKLTTLENSSKTCTYDFVKHSSLRLN